MQIYIARGGQHHGPYDLEALKAGLGTGAFSPADLAWYEGAPNWAPLSTLPGLQSATPAPAPAPTPTPPPVTPVPPVNPPVAPVYDPNATWARGASRGRSFGDWFKLMPVRIGVGVLGSIIIWLGIRQMVGGNRGSGGSSSSLSSSAKATPAAGTLHYVNDARSLGQGWRSPILEFSFDYPEHAEGWTLPPQHGSPDSACYVRTQREAQVDGRSINVELFNIFYTALSRGDDGSAVARQINAKMARSQGYRRQEEKKTRLGSLDAYELLGVQTSSGETIYWRWIVVLPPDPSKGGLVLEMGCDSQGTEVRSAGEVGTKGALAVMLNSFRLGK